jgi:hypothetical protein
MSLFLVRAWRRPVRSSARPPRSPLRSRPCGARAAPGTAGTAACWPPRTGAGTARHRGLAPFRFVKRCLSPFPLRPPCATRTDLIIDGRAPLSGGDCGDSPKRSGAGKTNSGSIVLELCRTGGTRDSRCNKEKHPMQLRRVFRLAVTFLAITCAGQFPPPSGYCSPTEPEPLKSP